MTLDEIKGHFDKQLQELEDEEPLYFALPDDTGTFHQAVISQAKFYQLEFILQGYTYIGCINCIPYFKITN